MATLGLTPRLASSPLPATTGKKKNNKKKKNANKPKPAAEVDHDGAQDHEREDVSDLIPDAPKVVSKCVPLQG